jgi:hypothetical protein
MFFYQRWILQDKFLPLFLINFSITCKIRKLPGAGGADPKAGAADITLEIAWQITETNMDINNATDFLLRAHQKT